jgi:hypothetical protein
MSPWAANRVGYRASLIAGYTVQVVGMILRWLGEGVSGLVTATVLVALGDAFSNRARTRRSCIEPATLSAAKTKFQAIEARANAVETIRTITGSSRAWLTE